MAKWRSSSQSLLISVRFKVFFPDAKIDFLGINCQILRDWIHLHIPKHEDGNNFGVEVQEEALQELQAVKEESQSQGSTDRKVLWSPER